MRTIGCFLMMGMILAFPQRTAFAAREALRIFAMDIVPCLYPYMVLTRCVTAGMKHTRGAAAFAAGALGLLCGSPSGASAIALFFEGRTMSRRTANTLFTLTGTISPVFLVNTAGGWLDDPFMTKCLVVSHFSGAAIAAAFVFWRCRHDTDKISRTGEAADAAGGSFITACIFPLLGIGGCLVFFSVLAALMNGVFVNLDTFALSAIHAALEIAGGLRAVSANISRAPSLTGIAAAAACGFSGISMLSQNALFSRQLGISGIQLGGMGLLRALFSGVIMAVLLKFR